MSPLERLYKTKFALLAVVSTFVGAGLILLAGWADSQPTWTWLHALPAGDFGLGLFTTGLFGVLFQHIGQRDAEEAAVQRLRSVLHDTAPDIRRAVVDGFAFEPDTLTKVSSPATLDKVIENSLAIRLGDRDLAAGVYADLRDQVLRAPERRYDLQVAVTLAPWEDKRDREAEMFVATIRWEYRTRPIRSILRFACVSNLDEYRELQQDATIGELWYFQPDHGLNAGSADAFDLVECTVDGRRLAARRTTRVGSQHYSVNLGDRADDGREVVISYTYRVLVKRHGHLLHVDISRLTKGLKVSFAYGGCGIRYVNVLEYIASSAPARVSRRPASDPAPGVDVAFDDWVMPKAGVAFVWLLDRELPRPLQAVSAARVRKPR